MPASSQGSADGPRSAAEAQAYEHTAVWLRAYRLIRVCLHILCGCFYVGALFPFMTQARRFRAIQKWSRSLLHILAVRYTLDGVLPSSSPTLIVSNHVSWLDIWIINAIVPVRFVAKSDIRRWPVLGFLVKHSGTIFIRRDKRRDTAHTNRAIVQALTNGNYVAIFAEGATTDGTQLKPYHASLLQPAVGAGAKVVVLAIRYVREDGALDLDAAYTDERSLWQSAQLILRHRTVSAEVVIAEVLEVSNKTRRQIAREAELATARALGFAPARRGPGTPGDLRAEAQRADLPKHNRYPSPLHSAPTAAPTLTSDRR
jgi:1-acyl-sn-glycerol-3-phosphate acyltransferase